jgi:hypothetical protein
MLEAVNEMLASVRESPVDSLTDSLPALAGQAYLTLGRVKRAVLRMGWTFNTEKDATLNRDVTAHTVSLGEDVLKVEFGQNCPMEPVLRGNRVFDQKTNSYTLSADILTKKIVRNLSWDDLPDTARQYISMRAARLFQARVLGNEQLERTGTIEELRSLRELMRDQGSVRRPNMLRSPGVNELAFRRGVWL